MGAAAQPQPDPDLMVEFRRLMDDTHAHYKTALQEVTDRGEVKGETKEAITKLNTGLADVVEKVTTALTDIRSIREKSSRPPVPLGAGPMEFRTLGAQFTESDNYKLGVQSSPTRVKLGTTIKARLIAPMEVRAINPFISTDTSGLVFFPKRVGVITQPVVPLAMRDLVDVVPLDTNAIEYVIENWTLNADYQVKEGDRKAQSDVTYTDKTVAVRTIAHFVKISRQMIQDAPYVRATIDNRLIYGIALKEDKEILYGDNAAGHLHGIMPQATAYSAGGLTIENQIEQIYAAMVQLMNAGYPPTAIVLNPMNFAGMSLTKTAQGVYLLGGPPAAEATPRLWGLPVHLTPNMAAESFLVGSFPGNAALFDREQANVEMATENEDDFVRNLVTIRAEERIALAVFVPQAFVKGTLMTPAPGTAARTAERK